MVKIIKCEWYTPVTSAIDLLFFYLRTIFFSVRDVYRALFLEGVNNKFI